VSGAGRMTGSSYRLDVVWNIATGIFFKHRGMGHAIESLRKVKSKDNDIKIGFKESSYSLESCFGRSSGLESELVSGTKP